MSNSVLVVEDNRETRVMLEAVLADAGFRPVCAGCVRDAETYLERHRPCLVILDLALPDGDGLDICRGIREGERFPDIPIIALTGKAALAEKKKGFSSGVDQYLTKPIDMDELVMWSKALLRRVSRDKSGGSSLRAGELEIDIKAHLVRYAGRTLESLTRREFQLLHALVKNSPAILSREEIISHVWRTAAVVNLVDTHLHNLRRKLPPELAGKVQAVPGKGYRYLG
ncbi:MAG TPA: DNA-binding response regulator [Elusimicrobia bacterium]|jgi:DNA-binding response OmpR family regulator|nr:DNA-binding response regulator [Elusimicrobiota bacterium]